MVWGYGDWFGGMVHGEGIWYVHGEEVWWMERGYGPVVEEHDEWYRIFTHPAIALNLSTSSWL